MVTAMNISKFAIPEIIFGRGSLDYAGQCARSLGAKKAFVVSDSGIEEAGWLQRLKGILEKEKIRWVYYPGVTSNPRDFQVEQGAELYIKNGADVIIAIGGGSVLDTAKGVAILASNGGAIADYEGANRVSRPLPPMLLITTTAGSGSDISQFCIITDVARQVSAGQSDDTPAQLRTPGALALYNNLRRLAETSEVREPAGPLQPSDPALDLALQLDAHGVDRLALAHWRIGQVVAAGQPVVRLARADALEVAFAVPEARAQAVRSLKVAEVSLWADGSRRYPAALRELSAVADPLTRTYAARVSILEPDEHVMLGMTANVTFPGETGGVGASGTASRIQVPLTAIFQQEGKPALWVVAPDQTIALRPVKVASFGEVTAVLESGVAVGESIAHGGQHVFVFTQRLTDHQRDRVLQGGADFLSAGDFTDAGMAGIIFDHHDIAREERGVRAAQVHQHAVVARDRNDLHRRNNGGRKLCAHNLVLIQISDGRKRGVYGQRSSRGSGTASGLRRYAHRQADVYRPHVPFVPVPSPVPRPDRAHQERQFFRF